MPAFPVVRLCPNHHRRGLQPAPFRTRPSRNTPGRLPACVEDGPDSLGWDLQCCWRLDCAGHSGVEGGAGLAPRCW